MVSSFNSFNCTKCSRNSIQFNECKDLHNDIKKFKIEDLETLIQIKKLNSMKR